MRAIIFRGKGNLLLEEYALSPLKEGWVRIRVEEAGICGSDLHLLKVGFVNSPGDLEGQILGHENAGVVVEVGKKVSRIKEGERVAIRPWITCGECSYCRSGLWVHCPKAGMTGYKHPGGFAQFIDVPENIVFKIPDSVSFSQASQLDGVACAVHALAVGGFKPGETGVVIGDGATGLYLQNAHARIAGIMRKSGVELTDKIDYLALKEKEAISLTRWLIRYPEIVKLAGDKYEPSFLCTYLLELARYFHKAYHLMRVKGEASTIAKARMNLFWATKQVLGNGMKLLGMKLLERM